MKHKGDTSTTASKCTFKVYLMVVIAFGLTALGFSISLAQVPPITSSGLNTQIGPPTTLPSGKIQYDITGGTRPGGGTNLYHSFGNFNVPNNNIANFLNNSGLATTNILGRVTGGNISNILGTIQTMGFGNANLFLMNPAGFLFGPNATVNVGGMVAFTSADYLRLADGAVFNAIPNPNADALLTAAPVAAFGFLGSNPGAITVQGSQLTVTEGSGISLVGGDILIQSGKLDNGAVQPARLSAPNGQINLASAASPGEFILESLQAGGFQSFEGFNFFNGSSIAGPNVNGALFTSFSSIHLAPDSAVNINQSGNSKVSISGGQFVIDIANGSLTTASISSSAPAIQSNVVLSPGSSIFTSNSVADRGPDIEIVADNIHVLGTPLQLPTPPTIATIQTQNDGTSAAGNISLTASQNLELFTSTVISGNTFTATGSAGNVSLSSTQGNISITSSSLVSSQGNAGSVSLSAPHGDILIDSSVVFTNILGPVTLPADAGAIHVTANNLTMRNGLGFIPPSIEGDNFNPQVPGNITINLSGKLTLDGQGTITTIARGPALAAADLNVSAHDVSITEGSLLSTQTQSSGAAGRLNIIADNLEVTNGGQITSGSALGHDPESGSPVIASGQGGTINIQGPSGPATSVLIDGAGSAILTSTVGNGAGGNIFVNAHSVTLQNGGTVSASTYAAGNAGNIQVSADSLSITSGANITSSSSVRQTPFFEGEVIPSPTGNAGSVTVQGLASPAQSVLIDGAGSSILTDTHGTGAGGNTNISAQSLTVQNEGTISAATSGTAQSATGGTITVDANQVQVNSGGLITASTTGAGAGGSVNINVGNAFSSNAGTVSSTASQANGGDINMSAGQSVTLTNGASVSASSTGTGNAGSIQINAGNQFTMTNSTVTTQANQASGGTIKITTAPNGTVELSNSTISASVLDGTGGGGSVNIDPQFVLLQNSQILAQAVQGPGGNISITTNVFLPDANSVVSASSQFGVNGTVAIQSPINPAGGRIIPLSQKPLTATALLSQRCAALAGGEFSSFTVAGRDSLPAEPGGWLASPLALTMLSGGTGLEARGEGKVLDEREARDWRERREAKDEGEIGRLVGETQLLSLRQIAPPGFLTQAFGVDWSAGCTS